LKRTGHFTLISLTESLDRFTYYGLQAILILYFIHFYHYTKLRSYDIYSVYVTMGFSAPVIAGYIADHFFGEKKMLYLGILLVIAGSLLMTQTTIILNLWGLSLLLLGFGSIKPCATSLLGKLFEITPKEKASAYTVFYMLMNTGALLGPLCYGLFTNSHHWRGGFYISAICFFMMLLFLSSLPKKLGTKPAKTRNLTTLIILAFLIAVVFFLFYFPEFLALLIGFIIAGAAINIIMITLKRDPASRHHILKVTSYFFWAIFYFAASLQIAGSILLFVHQFVNRTIGDYQIPASFFASIGPFTIILATPFIYKLWKILANKNKRIADRHKISLGLLLAGLGFFCCFGAVKLIQLMPTSYLGMMIVAIGIGVISLGELMIIPTIMTAISENIPTKLNSTMMGTLFLVLGVGGFIAGNLAKFSTNLNNTSTTQTYAKEFLITASIIVIVIFIKYFTEQLFFKSNKQKKS